MRSSVNTKEKPVDESKKEILTFKNKRKYIKLSGYAWEDMYYGKQSNRNSLYNSGNLTDENGNIIADKNDERLNNVKVTLYKGDGTELECTTKTIINTKGEEEKGAYIFGDYQRDSSAEKIKIEDLEGAYIEFKYNGMSYKSVEIKKDENGKLMDNGNKATDDNLRETFNEQYSIIENNKAYDSVKTLPGLDLQYDYKDYASTLKYENESNYKYGYDGQRYPISGVYGQYLITANTKDASPNKLLGQELSLQDIYDNGIEEIPNINLGLYEREQPDISLVKDLYNVKLSINGYNHVYDYNQRFKESIDVPNDAGDGNDNNFNVGVRYKDKFKGSYNRAIYQSDYDYTVSGGKNKLEVYVTYQLRMNNESSSLKTRVNSIVDYYDDNYELYRVGNSIDSGTRDVEDNISHDTPEDLPGNYTKVKLNLPTDDESTKVEHGKYTDIYVQFKLKDQAVINIINNKENLNNIAEINSYSVFNTNGNIYAGIDRDSNPGSVSPENPADVTTHQDDTSSAPGLLLQVEGTRTMAGKVFLDESIGGIGVERKGDGEYKEGEKGISGVNVTLNETSGSGQTYTATTDSNGDFYISGYIPGDYTLTYTWGDETYTVQDYKGTLYNDKDRATDKNWYKATEPRYSDALDNYKTREKIDAETKIITGTTTTKINKMDSITPLMGIGIEEETDGNTKFGTTSIETETDGDKFIPKGFSIKNIDFGITERARQQIDISKKVKTVKITLANGQTIVDAEVILKGDVNGDGQITTKDAKAIENYVAEQESFTEEQKLKADVDGDGYIKINDATYITEYVEGIHDGNAPTIEWYKLKGESKGLTYMGPSKNNIPKNGYLKSEMDSELIQGSTIEIGYEIIVKNNSEVDYDSENYYKYGKLADNEKPEDKIIKITPVGVYDYLDKSMIIDKENEKNSGWTTMEQTDYEKTIKEKTTIENYFSYIKNLKVQDENGKEENIDITGYTSSYEEFYSEITEWSTEEIKTARKKRLADKTILNNAQLEDELSPGKSNMASLYVTKVLANSDGIDLNNDAEITEVSRSSTTGRKITPTSSIFYDRGETITVMPATGENKSYTTIILLAISLFTILGTGTVFIKKKIIG